MKKFIILLLIYIICCITINTFAKEDGIPIRNLIKQEKAEGIKDIKEKNELFNLVKETAIKNYEVGNINELNITGGFKVYALVSENLKNMWSDNISLSSILEGIPYYYSFVVNKKNNDDYSEYCFSKDENNEWKTYGEPSSYHYNSQVCDEEKIISLLEKNGILKADYFTICSHHSSLIYDFLYVRQGNKEFFIPFIEKALVRPWWAESEKAYERSDEEIQAFGLGTLYDNTNFYVGGPEYPVWVFVNKKNVVFDVEPLIKNDEILYIPIRQVSEALGAKVEWNEKDNSVTIKSDNNQTKFYISKAITDYNDKSLYYTVRHIENKSYKFSFAKTTAFNNSNTIDLEYATEIFKNRTMVPLDFINKIFNVNIDYNSNSGIVKIYTKAK